MGTLKVGHSIIVAAALNSVISDSVLFVSDRMVHILQNILNKQVAGLLPSVLGVLSNLSEHACNGWLIFYGFLRLIV
uniref:Uncharacterized protein n=1 Tax=Candidatus Kentrum sp. LFY TaxID=2126342 RepID=A0A450VBI0_9GAMM|nr:MAG: hypothetical protein BECKLFY1418A_GA0070994_11782 [Candidatus Kentron sp. LFY]